MSINCLLLTPSLDILMINAVTKVFSSILNNEKLIAELITPFKKFNSLALNTSNNFITIIILIPPTMV
ncbi:protein of unknown function [Streptococcus thermophilus]|nr:protein of unknown function [Streptococcus thermophilus]CAD0176612.1 protein of unknown function [Streptococcus thermophilus]